MTDQRFDAPEVAASDAPGSDAGGQEQPHATDAGRIAQAGTSILRDYQTRAVADVEQAFGAARRVLLVCPTGGGKTVIGAELVRRHLEAGDRVAWFAHRRELVRQARDRLPGRVGVVLAGEAADPEASVQVLGTFTAARREALPDAGLVVVDEAHHVRAETWTALLDRYPEAKIVGLTATPQRGDGKGLGDAFETIVHGPSVKALIKLGHLVPIDIIAPTSARSALAEDPVTAWVTHAPKRPGFLFASTVADSLLYADGFGVEGINAAHVDAATPPEERAEAIAAFRRGEVQILCSVGVFTEGVDLPRAEVCCLARGADHAGTFLQMAGRVLRPHPGKARALLLDLRGVVHRHGRPDADRIWDLSDRPAGPSRDGDGTGEGRRETLIRRTVLRLLANTAGEESAEDKLRFLAHARARQAAQKYKPGWAAHRFRERFGDWPPRGWERWIDSVGGAA